MRERDISMRAFLEAHGWAGATRSRLAGDASFRHYDRLCQAQSRAVLMDAPPPREDVRPFVAIARHLGELGYSAPKIRAEDAEAGFLLLEDLGDATYTRALDAGIEPEMLYGAAIDLLADLHRHQPPADLAPYDEGTYLAEADLLVDWFLPAVTKRETDAMVRNAYRAAWDVVLAKVDFAAPVLVLRDYHADNLMWLPDRTGNARVGLLDFQDARAGSRAYDMVSLLEDVRRDVSPALAEAMIARYLASAPGVDETRFRDAYAVLGGQRNAKIVGIFTRLWKRDGKAGYLDMIPNAWRLLEHDLAQPVLAPVRDWFNEYVPAPLRRAPAP